MVSEKDTGSPLNLPAKVEKKLKESSGSRDERKMEKYDLVNVRWVVNLVY